MAFQFLIIVELIEIGFIIELNGDVYFYEMIGPSVGLALDVSFEATANYMSLNDFEGRYDVNLYDVWRNSFEVEADSWNFTFNPKKGLDAAFSGIGGNLGLQNIIPNFAVHFSYYTYKSEKLFNIYDVIPIMPLYYRIP